MTEAEVVEKFRPCLDWGPVAEPAAMNRLVSAIAGLETLEDAGALVDAFRALSAVQAAA